MTVLVEITAAIDAAGTLKTFYFSDENFRTRPVDTPASQAFDARLIDPGSITSSAFGDGTTGGASKVSNGEIAVINTDGALDALANYSFDGRSVLIKVGTRANNYSQFVTVMSATIETIEADQDRLIFRLRDLLYILQVPVCQVNYAGTNSLPNGLEGTPDDIKGNPKPKLYGAAFNISPPCVNTSKLTYQVNIAGAFVQQVYDNGVALTFYQNYATSADLQAATIPAANFGTCFNEGYFRLGSSPTSITADVTQSTKSTLGPVSVGGTDSGGRNLYSIVPLRYIDLVYLAGVSQPVSARFTNYAAFLAAVPAGGTCVAFSDLVNGGNSSSVKFATNPVTAVTLDVYSVGINITYADCANALLAELSLGTGFTIPSGYYAGIWIADQTTYLQALDQLSACGGVFYYFRPTGTITSQILGGTVVNSRTLESFEVLAIRRRPAGDAALPSFSVKLNYAKNYTIQTTPAGSVSAARISFINTELRSVVSQDVSVKTQFLLSKQYERDTLLTRATDANTEVARLLALYKVPRAIYEIDIDYSIYSAMTTSNRAILSYQVSPKSIPVRFGLDGSKVLRVIGYTIQLKRNVVTLVCWG